MADKPVTREEKYLAYLTGDYTGEIPKPITRKEKYLYELCLKGMGGEISPEEIKNAVNEYLEKNPVKPGATTEQAQQIEQNKTDVASLKEETGSLKSDKITKPAEAPTTGKILRVKSVNEDGTFVCEWSDGGGNNWQIIMDETLAELTQEVSFEVPDDTKEMICFFKSGETLANTSVYLRTDSSTSIVEGFAPFGGSLLTNAISIGCQKIQFINSQYGLVEYSYLSHTTPSTSDDAQRLGKASLLRIDKKRFFFHSVESGSGYPVGTRLLVLVRR